MRFQNSLMLTCPHTNQINSKKFLNCVGPDFGRTELNQCFHGSTEYADANYLNHYLLSKKRYIYI